MTTLASTLDEVRRRIKRNGSKSMNEENTKATLIDPVLRALGWDTEDLDQVQHEFKVKTRDKPVDYALLSMRNVRLFIEAKALGEDLGDRRWTNQIMGYATVAGVEWIVLTNGAEYWIYNTHAPVAVEEKLFRKFTVANEQETEAAIETLELLAKSRLEENRIQVLWRAHFVDGQVRQAIEDLFSRDGSDMLLVNHVLKRTKNLSAEEIRSSIARCRVTLDFPVAPPEDTERGNAGRKKGRTKVDTRGGVAGSLGQILDDGLLSLPAVLVHKYKGKILTASVLPDGRLRVDDREYDSPSSAAVAVLKKATGEDRSANGWDFWQVDDGGALVPLSTLRKRLQRRSKAATSDQRTKSSG